MVSLKSSSSAEFGIKKILLNFVFFEEILRYKILCEHEMFGMILFPFNVVFVQIKIFFFNKIY